MRCRGWAACKHLLQRRVLVRLCSSESGFAAQSGALQLRNGACSLCPGAASQDLLLVQLSVLQIARDLCSTRPHPHTHTRPVCRCSPRRGRCSTLHAVPQPDVESVFNPQFSAVLKQVRACWRSTSGLQRLHSACCAQALERQGEEALVAGSAPISEER